MKKLAFIKKVLKRIVFSFLLIYGYNLIASPLNVIVPMNLITIGSIAVLGVPVLFSFISIFLIFF